MIDPKVALSDDKCKLHLFHVIILRDRDWSDFAIVGENWLFCSMQWRCGHVFMQQSLNFEREISSSTESQ